MADAALLAEAYKRGLLPAEKSAAYEEGVRRGIVKDDYAQGRIWGRNPATGASATFNESIPLADEYLAGMGTIADTLQGKGSFGDNWKTRRARQAGEVDQFKADHPTGANAMTALGYGAQVVPALMTGGGSVAPQVESAATKTIAQRAGRVTMTGARNATVGAAYASGNAAAGRGTAQERLDAAGHAVLPGAIAGLTLPVAAAGVSMTGKLAGRVAGATTRTAVRAVNNVASKGPSGPFLDPAKEVLKRLAETLQGDGLGPEQINAALSEWQRVGAPSPAFMDIVAKNGGGQKTMALIRGAGMQGAGRNEAAKYSSQVVADVQDKAIDRTRLMTGDQRPAAQVVREVKATRQEDARTMYPEFADKPVLMGPDILSAADGSARWMQGAADLAVAERKFDVADEIAAVVNGQPPHSISAGAVDYMRRSLRDASQAEFKAGHGSMGQALKDRATDLETALMDVPGFDTARSTYRAHSRKVEAVDGKPNEGIYGGRQVMTAPPDEYGASIGAHAPGAKPYVEVGARQAITDAIGQPAEGATGVLNRIGSGTNIGRNLRETFGEPAAADYQGAIKNTVEQVRNARFIDPNTGSPTAPRLADETLVENIPTSKRGAVQWIVDKFKSGATLTDQERGLLVRLATGQAEATAERVAPMLHPPPPVSMTRRTPVAPVLAAPMTQENRR